MPIDYKKYPRNWKAISARVIERDHNRCQQCGVGNHAVGYRDAEKNFVPLAGNIYCDCAGQGLSYPSLTLLSYAEAKEYADAQNTCGKCDDDGNKWIVIVLTIAHYPDPDPMNCKDENLQALCQRCHNKLDVPYRSGHATETRRRAKYRGQMELNV